MTIRLKPRLTPDPTEEAARWLLQLEAGKLSAGRQAEFERWVAADATHRAALESAAGALEVASRHAAAPDIMQMREAALGARKYTRGTAWALAAGIVGIGIGVTALWMSMRVNPAQSRAPATVAPTLTAEINPPPTHYETAVGERATISLPDGSTATLDTHSALDVAYSSNERGIRLIRGQALFEVAKHKTTPFQVYAGNRRITAVGTMFNVRLDGTRLRVALLEGKIRVAVQRPGDFSAPIEQVTMSPGEVLEALPAAPMIVKVADAYRAASWREGVAVFVDTRLADVVAEMNRYTAMPIAIDDPATGELRISGVFKTGDPDRFAESVAKVFPLTADHTPAGEVVLRAVSFEK
jgi:transmembrane sensor